MERIALIPAYQPEEKLLEIITGLQREGFHIVVVDDGSGQGFIQVFMAAAGAATVLAHGTNKGKGAALKTGLTYIHRHFQTPYTVVIADADGQHRIPDIVKVCKEADIDRDSLILGSRRFDQEGVPLRSKFGNTVTRAVFRISSGVRVYDTQTGLRAFSDRLVGRMLMIGGERYEYEMNVLMQHAEAKIPIREITVETVYLDDNASSHFDTVRDSIRIYREILKFSASSLLSFALDYALYCLFCGFMGLTAANITARVGSAACNYILNKNIVFGSGQSTARSLVQYVALAAFILLCNTVLLNMMAHIGINRYLAKATVEFMMFIFSYTIQHKVIFRKEARS